LSRKIQGFSVSGLDTAPGGPALLSEVAQSNPALAGD
jgi:hypothetical protein